MLLGANKFTEFLQKINNAVGGYLWAILAGVVILLFVILCLVIAHKNKRIRKLKAEIKSTRTQLEIERNKAKNAETFAPVTGKKLFGEEKPASAPAKQAEPPEEEAETVEEEIDAEPEAEDTQKKQRIVLIDDELERASRRVSYYNKASVVGSKEGNVKFIVKYDRAKDSWVIKKEGLDRAVRRVDTKEEALNIARALCKKYNANLVVHKKDGKFQRQ